MNLNNLIAPLFGEGFGFNDNILETNIINLSAVLGIVVFFVGQNLTAALQNRRETILNNLREADLRATEAQEKLLNARNQFEFAQKKAKEIREEGVLKATLEKTNCLKQYEFDLARLEEYKQENLNFYQQKIFQQVYISLVSRALAQVKEKFKKRLNGQFNMTINNFFIARFTDYLPS
uniref:ATP synthase CF0 subunit I n=1 Tax=Hydrocytium acuminatum TaxID=1745963 RepID=UPI002A80D73E|nr:ATP synthase CF0 subunit I [Hydrocytium acuminatum]WOR09601.1 ATP synthase CF0 subunit I [Hydrocytium acuminatum]